MPVKLPLYLSSLALMLPFFALAESTLFPSFTAHYQIRINTLLVAELKQELTGKQNNEFIYKTSVKTKGLARLFKKDITHEVSHFKFDRHQLIPSYYFFHRQRKKNNQKIEINFNYDKHIFTSVINGISRDISFTPPIADKLASQFELMYQLSKGNELLIQKITHGKEPKTYRFTKLNNEALPFSDQTFFTEKWQRTKINSIDKTILWLAPRLNYLPIKIEIHQHGEDIISLFLTMTSLLTINP